MNNAPKQSASQIKLEFWHWFAIAMGVILLVAAIFRILSNRVNSKLTVSKEITTSNYDKTTSSFKKVSYSGQPLTLPEKLTVWKQNQINFSADTLAGQIISMNNLVANETNPNYWTNEQIQLAKSNYEHNYTFVEILSDVQNDVRIIKDRAIATCLDFYKKYNINLELVVQDHAIAYYGNQEEPTRVDEKDAFVAAIPLTYELSGYPVFHRNESEYPFTCKIDNNYNLNRVVFKDFFAVFEPNIDLSPITIDQAINNIKNSNASIVDARSQIVDIIDLNWIESADLQSVSIEYRYDDALKMAYPFYKFSGQLTNSAGINMQAEIITPAVATTTDDR